MTPKQTIIDHTIDFFISPEIKKYPFARRIWLATLLILEIAAWKTFLFGPNNICNYRDWSEIVFPRPQVFSRMLLIKAFYPCMGLITLSLVIFIRCMIWQYPTLIYRPNFTCFHYQFSSVSAWLPVLSASPLFFC